MKRILLSLLFVVLIASGSWITIDSKTSSYLEWSEYRKLEWSDFQGPVNYYSHADAATAIHISARPFYKKKKLFYQVEAYFIPHKSWCKARSKNLLEHEQLHFDIAELYARKVRKKISEYSQMGIKDVAEYNHAISKILNESNRVDIEYDSQTLHGSFSKNQIQWEKNIQQEMKILSRFSKASWNYY